MIWLLRDLKKKGHYVINFYMLTLIVIDNTIQLMNLLYVDPTDSIFSCTSF